MKLSHDIENDLEHTIPGEGGWDSRRLFRAMTERSLALAVAPPAGRVLDLACGMGQDTLALAQGGANGDPGMALPALAVGLEPSNRMIRFAQWRLREKTEGAAGGAVRLCRALGEELPFRGGSFDAVLCKGALDHFEAPEQAMEEVARVLKPGGRAVVALANYDSLSCRLGKALHRLRAAFGPGDTPAAHPYFEPPPDHLTRYGFASIAALARPPLRAARLEGISLLWGLPGWGAVLDGLPPVLREGALGGAFALGRYLPEWADVVVLQAVKEE